MVVVPMGIVGGVGDDCSRLKIGDATGARTGVGFDEFLGSWVLVRQVRYFRVSLVQKLKPTSECSETILNTRRRAGRGCCLVEFD